MDTKLFLDVISKCNLATISTINANGKPQAAVIGIGHTSDFEIIFGTFNTTRKYKNIQADPSVALVIGWEDGRTVQYEGTARELTPDEIHLVRDNLWAKNPGTKKYYADERQRYFIVNPTWMRYTDMTTEPRYVIEHVFKKLTLISFNVSRLIDFRYFTTNKYCRLATISYRKYKLYGLR